MKNLEKTTFNLFFILLLFPQLVLYAQNKPEITFEETEYNFGEITQGDIVDHIFIFKNSGDAPLIISDVRTTCGCTVPEWPQNPIPPNNSEEIRVKFNSRGKMGKQNKIITIVTNTVKSSERIVLKGEVKAKVN